MENKKTEEIDSVDGEYDQEIESRLALSKAQDFTKATSNEIGYKRRHQRENHDEKIVGGVTVASSYPLDAIPHPGEVDQEKERLSKQRLKDYFKQGDSSPSTATRIEYRFKVDPDADEDREEDVYREIRGGRLQALARATGKDPNEIESCGYSITPQSRNSDIDDSIKINKARLDRIQ